MLEIKNLYKSYIPNEYVIKDINLKISKGDIFAFIGPNGSGKTTLIKAICGIHSFEKGEIFIDGESLKENELSCKRKLAYVSDNPDIYDFMTGNQYLNFICDIYNVSKEVREERIKKYSELFEIKNDLSTKISQYSHGMKQKLVITSVFARDCKLLIFDEPFVGLDPKASHSLKTCMKSFVKDGGAIFFSTHVLEVAEKLCNKVAIIHKSNVVAEGSMEKIKGNKSLEDIFLEIYQ